MRTNWPLGALCLALGFSLGFLCFHSKKQEIHVAAFERKEVPLASSLIQKTRHSWGNLEALKIPFADPQNIFSDRAARLQKAQWFFENYSAAQLTEFLLSCGINEQEQKELKNNSPVELATNGCLMHPSENLIRTLHSEARGKIYSALEKSRFNYAQQYPFRFALDQFASRFDGSGLSAEKLATMRSLTYTNQNELCLADIQALSQILSPDEFNHAIESLYRFPVYRLRLRLFADSDIDAAVNYWGRGGRELKIRPLISSLAKVPKEDGASTSISLLLPTFARLHLYTFPNAWSGTNVAREDCFWSSMNFFNEQPDDAFLQSENVKETLRTKYHLVQGEPKLGDLITLLDQTGNGLHMCVYLADNFVFTKNGVNNLSPWVIMKISDMLLLFPSRENRKFVIYRRNDLP